MSVTDDTHTRGTYRIMVTCRNVMPPINVKAGMQSVAQSEVLHHHQKPSLTSLTRFVRYPPTDIFKRRVSERVGSNGTFKQFRSLAWSLTQKAGTESPTVKENRRYINLANAIKTSHSPTTTSPFNSVQWLAQIIITSEDFTAYKLLSLSSGWDTS